MNRPESPAPETPVPGSPAAEETDRSSLSSPSSRPPPSEEKVETVGRVFFIGYNAEGLTCS